MEKKSADRQVSSVQSIYDKNDGKAQRRSRFIRAGLTLGLVIAFCVVIFLLWVRFTDNSEFETSFYEIFTDKLKAEMRIAFLSDLHLSEFGKDNIDLVEGVRKLKPDIIAIGGDMNTEGVEDYSIVITLCEQLVDIAPVYYGMGNHEFREWLFNDSKIVEDVQKTGVTVLMNNYRTIDVNGNLIDIGGLAEDPGNFKEYSQKFYNSYMQSKNYRLLLVHYPNYFNKNGHLYGADIDLALSGHVHGGHIVIPYIGGLYHPGSGFLPPLTDGCNLIADTYVVVSRGLGNQHSLPRINNPPELVVIDLYPEK